MIMGCDPYEGEGVHIYRSLSEIRRDIESVSDMIADINDMLNIRDMLMQALNEEALSSPSEWLPEILELTEGAREGLRELELLNETLEELKEELAYTREALYDS